MTIKKFILVTMLTMVICIMSLGYAALQEKIDITGGASVDSVYRVEITKVEQTSLTGTATEKDIPSYTELNANFNVGLTNTTDSITYNIAVSNLGTVDVKLNDINVGTDNTTDIKVEKEGISNGDIILAGENKTLTTTISKRSDITGETTGKVNVTFECTRLKGSSGEVAVDYKEVNYLESTGTEYIDTGMVLTQNSSIEIEFEPIQSTNSSVFGSRTNGSTNNIGIGLQPGGSGLYVDFNNSSYSKYRASYAINIGEKYKVSLNKNKREISLNGTVVKTNDVENTDEITTQTTACIFKQCGSPSDPGKFIGKIYYVKIWENDILQRHFVPVVDSNDVACLYDLIEQKFYYNVGTGDFLYG